MAISKSMKFIAEMERKHNKKGEGVNFERKIFENVNDPSFERWLPLPLPGLQKVFGGQLLKGRIYQFQGQESTGKSTIATYMAACVQQEPTQNNVLYVDFEMSFKPDFAKALGVDITPIQEGGKFLLCQPLTGEEAFDVINGAIETGEFGLIIFDSDATVATDAELEKGADIAFGGAAKLFAGALRRLNGLLKKSGTILCWISQERASMEMYGSPVKATGGNAIRYYAAGRFKISRRTDLFDAGNNKASLAKGIVIKIKNLKNKVKVPFRETELYLDFAKGFDVDGSYVEAIIDLKIIPLAGAWYKDLERGISVQGSAKLKEWLLDPLNKDVFEELKQKVTEAYTNEIEEDKSRVVALNSEGELEEVEVLNPDEEPRLIL